MDKLEHVFFSEQMTKVIDSIYATIITKGVGFHSECEIGGDALEFKE